MRTSDLLLRQVRHALAAVFLLGGFAALLQVIVPLCALHVIDSAIPARSTETLLLLVVLASGALISLTCLNIARGRILVRAGLWLDHTLGSHTLQEGLARDAQPDAIEEDSAALATLRDACTGSSMRIALESPWIVLVGTALCLLDWRLGAICGIAAVALVLSAAIAYRSLQERGTQTAQAERRAASWLRSIVRMTGLPRMPATAAEQWERLNRESVASAYLLHLQSASLGEFARFIRYLALIATFALGAWLVMGGELTAGALVAAMLLLWCALAPLESTLASLADVASFQAAWRRIVHRSGPEIGRPAPYTEAADLPRLRFAGPFATGLAAGALFLAVIIGAAATTRVGQIAILTGGTLFDTKLAAVFPKRKGLSAHVMVTEGASVKKGDLLATLDTKNLDARMAALKLQAATAQIELSALNREVAALTAPGAPPLKNRAPLEKLEARIEELGRQSRDLTVQIAVAEDELAQSQILAPVSGRLVSVTARPGMPVETNVPLATLVTSDTTLLGRLLAPLSLGAFPQAMEKLTQLLGMGVANAREFAKG